MNSKIIIALFIVTLFTTSCLAQAPASSPTTTDTPPSPATTPSSDTPTASPPAPEGPGVSPGDLTPLTPPPSDVASPPPNVAFSNKAFVVGTVFAAVIYAVVLA